jgi:GxxExxY protein
MTFNKYHKNFKNPLNMKKMHKTKKELDELTYIVIGAAIEVHKELGPGLLEQVYHKCMLHELSLRGIRFKSELTTPINYKGIEIDANLRLDLLIEDILPVELKATDGIAPVFEAQILSYMKLLKAPKGLLINFNVTNIVNEGQRTFVNRLYSDLD